MSGLTVERITSAATFADMREEWTELLADSGGDTLFLTWEWLHAWWRHLAESRRLALITVRRDGRLVALAPLAVRPPSLARLQPIPALEFLGTGTAGSDYLDVIVRRGAEAEAVPALAEFLAGRAPMLELSHVHAGASVAADLAARLARQGWTASSSTLNMCPFIPLSGLTWASYLASLGSAHRYNVQRRIKNLDKQFTVSFTRARTEDERREALTLLVALHNRRWDERGGSESFSTPALLAFYDEASRLALARDWLRLYVLRLDGHPVAALHGYAYGGTFLFYQAGFDPEYRKQSVGLVTMGLAIKSAIEEGLDEYDLLHGDESYKFQWAPKSRDLARLEAFPGSRRGRLGRHAMGASRALRQRARRLLGDSVADRLIAALRELGLMPAVRQVIYWLLVLSGLAWLAMRLNRRKVLVLAYHGVYAGPNDPLLNHDGMHVRERRFARQIRWVARRYRVVPIDELRSERAAARTGRPRAVITLDDGYRNVHRAAFPVLKSLSLPATLFLPTDFVLGRRGLWWDRLRAMLATTAKPTLACSLAGTDHLLPIRTVAERVAAAEALSPEIRNVPPARREELLAAVATRLAVSGREAGAFGEPLAVGELREMLRYGITVGSHGTTHASFVTLGPDDLARELTASKRVLEWLTNSRVRWLAYPHGDTSPAVADAVRRAGYHGAVTTVEALADGRGGPYAVTRIGVHDNMTMAHFIVAVSGLHDLFVAVAAAARRLRRWAPSIRLALPSIGARSR